MKKTILLAILATIYTQALTAAELTPATGQADAIDPLTAHIATQSTVPISPGTTSGEGDIGTAQGTRIHGSGPGAIGGIPAPVVSNTPAAPSAICSFINAFESAGSTLRDALSSAYGLFTTFLVKHKII